MKFVYLLEYRQLSRVTNLFEVYNYTILSSKKKILDEVANIIECNKGTDVVNDTTEGTEIFQMTTYNCLSTDGQPMRLRLVLHKKELR